MRIRFLKSHMLSVSKLSKKKYEKGKLYDLPSEAAMELIGQGVAEYSRPELGDDLTPEQRQALAAMADASLAQQLIEQAEAEGGDDGADAEGEEGPADGGDEAGEDGDKPADDWADYSDDDIKEAAKELGVALTTGKGRAQTAKSRETLIAEITAAAAAAAAAAGENAGA